MLCKVVYLSRKKNVTTLVLLVHILYFYIDFASFQNTTARHWYILA